MEKEKQQIYEVTHAIFNSQNIGERVILGTNVRDRWYGPWFWGRFTRLDSKGKFYKSETHDKIRVKKLEGEFFTKPTVKLIETPL